MTTKGDNANDINSTHEEQHEEFHEELEVQPVNLIIDKNKKKNK